MTEKLHKSRMCHLKKSDPKQDYGFTLQGKKTKKGQYVGKVETGCPADLAGLKAGDKILAVNGHNVEQDDHEQVVEKIRENSMECKLLVLSDDDDSNNRKTSAGSLTTVSAVNAYKLLVKNEGVLVEKHLKPRLCVLKKTSFDDEYGFKLHIENGPKYYIGEVDEDSIAETAGLREGQRIVGVNNVLIGPTTMRKEFFSLIKEKPSSVNILVASSEVDDYYEENSLSFSFDDIANDISKKDIRTKQINQHSYVNFPNSAIDKKVEEQKPNSIKQLYFTKVSVNDGKVVPFDQTRDDNSLPSEPNRDGHKQSNGSAVSAAPANNEEVSAMELEREHIRAIIYYNWKRGLSQTECDNEMANVLGESAPHLNVIKRWYGEFERERESVEDDPNTGRMKSATSKKI